jgi:Tol biopolymer transport system component
VSDGQWQPDSTSFALAIVGNSGCYPDYLDSWIDTFDPDGKMELTLVEEAESRITTLGWSPDGEQIAYDVYSTDFVGRLKVIDVARADAREIVNTRGLGYDVDRSAPATLLFADWIAPAERP